MSALGDRRYGLSRARALIAARPGAFLVGTLLSALTLAVPMLAVTLGIGLLPWVEQNQPQPEVIVLMSPGLSAREVDSVNGVLSGMESVREIRWIPRDQALAELAKRYELGTAASEGRSNPLPDVFVVRFATGTDADEIAARVSSMTGLPGVVSIRAELDWYRRLLSIGRVAAATMAGLAALALLLVLLAVAAAVREQSNVQANEIRVLRWFGATPAFMARPYVYLAAITLTLAALLAAAATVVGVTLIGRHFGVLLGQTGGFRLPPLWLAVALIVTACLAGALVGRMAVGPAIRR